MNPSGLKIIPLIKMAHEREVIGFIGAGNMAQAIGYGFLSSGKHFYLCCCFVQSISKVKEIFFSKLIYLFYLQIWYPKKIGI